MATTPNTRARPDLGVLFSLLAASLPLATAQIAPTAAPAGSAGAPVTLEPVEVTGSRIRSVLGEATAQPVITYTREDFERLGIATLQDFNTYIPQLPTIAWESTPETGYVNLANDGGRTNFNGGLRALGNTATLILVNGRRVPKLGQAMGSDSYDFGGVPISSIERVEVLTDGASAVYGADAMAGVINIILKKEYRGSQLRVTYANTFNSDTANREVSLSSGWRVRNLTLNTTIGWSKTSALSPKDRWYMASNDRRWLGGTDGRANIPAGTGVIRPFVAGTFFPGTTLNNLIIPAGADGRTTTAAQFIAAGPWDATDRFDQPKYQVYGDRMSRNARLQGEYEINPRLAVFFDGSWKKDTSFRPGDYRTISVTNIPVGYPGNPFPIAITVQRVFWEMVPYLETHLATDTYSGLTGLRGKLGKSWRWESGIQHQRSAYSVTGLGSGGTLNTTAITQAKDNPAIRPILLNDGLSNSPNSAAVMQTMLFDGNYSERPTTWNYDAKADGPVWSLPAGDIQAAIGIERREEYANFKISPTDIFGRLATAVERSANSLFAEVQVPLASDKKRWPGLYKASVNFSARRDEYSDFGAGTVPRTSAIWHPFKALALRASIGRGYKAPNLSSVYSPVRESTVSIGAIAAVFDTKRNELVTGPVQQISGGSKDLKAERSENRNFGALLDVPYVKGLSLGIDYYEIKQSDTVGGSLALIVPNYEFRLQRAAPSAADIARNVPGLVTTIDVRPLNLANIRTAGIDYQARYFRRFERVGDFNLRLTATKPKVSKTQSAPNQGIVNNLPGGYWRGTGVLTWSRKAWTLGGTATYTSRYIGRYFPGGTYFNNGTVNKPITLWDAQASYDFAQGRWQPTSWMRHAFRDLRVSANVYNLRGKEPALDPVSKAPILGTVDPRGRRFQATLTKKL